MTKRARSPVLGYNHNLRYRGRVFHVQTEDSGPAYARLYTHLFFEGTILSSKKEEYDPESAEDAVRASMQKLHKLMIRELTRGEHNERIEAFFAARGESAALEPAPVAPAPPAAEAAPAVVVAGPKPIGTPPPVVVAGPKPMGTPPPVVKPNTTPKPVVIVQPSALKRSPVVVANPADGVVVRRNVVIDVGAGQPPVHGSVASPPAAAHAPPARPKRGAPIAVRDGSGYVAGNRARAVEAAPQQPLASTREIRMPWETPAPRRVAPAAASATPAPEPPPVSATGKLRMPWDPPGAAETAASDKSLDEVILEYLADETE
jgi:hypothetical protein